MSHRLVLVDDHALFRGALGSALRAGGFDVVAEASDARTSFALIDQTHPDCVLLDLRLPGMDGVTAVRELVSRPRSPKVMVLTAYASPRLIADSWAAGAHGVASKSSTLEQLTDGITRIIAGERWLAPGLPSPESSGDPLAPLSPRERDVFRMLVRGLTTRQLAAELCISAKTIETHRERIFRKLDVHSAVELVRFAAKHDVLE